MARPPHASKSERPTKQPFRADKNLGQHWLVDASVVAGIVGTCNIADNDGWILEIGPGQGILTQALLDAGARVLAVDLDRRAIGYLTERFADAIANGQLVLHHGDILALSPTHVWDILAPLGITEPKPFTLVGNLPYQITSRILVHFLGDLAVHAETHPWRAWVTQLVVMVQKEVGERLMGHPGTKAYNALSIAMQRHNQLRWVIPHIPPKAFQPPPKVNSAVVALTPRPEPICPDINSAVFQQVVRGAFAQRRKTLKNTLGNLFSPEQLTPAFTQLAQQRNITLDKALQLRAEALTIEEFGALTTRLEPFSTVRTIVELSISDESGADV